MLIVEGSGASTFAKGLVGRRGVAPNIVAAKVSKFGLRKGPTS